MVIRHFIWGKNNFSNNGHIFVYVGNDLAMTFKNQVLI